MKSKKQEKIFLLVADLINKSGYYYTNWFQTLIKFISELILFYYRNFLESDSCLGKCKWY